MKFLSFFFWHTHTLTSSLLKNEWNRERKRKKSVEKVNFVWEKKRRKKNRRPPVSVMRMRTILIVQWEPKQRKRSIRPYIYIYICICIQRHGIVHFASGHKYVESGKKRRKNREKRREKKKKVIDRYLQEKAKNRKNDRKERENEFYIYPYITNGYYKFASHLRLPSILLCFFLFCKKLDVKEKKESAHSFSHRRVSLVYSTTITTTLYSTPPFVPFLQYCLRHDVYSVCSVLSFSGILHT